MRVNRTRHSFWPRLVNIMPRIASKILYIDAEETRHGAEHAVLVFLSRDGVWLGLGFRALYHMSLPEGTAQVHPSVRNVIDSRINIVGEIVALGASRLAPDSKEGRPWT